MQAYPIEARDTIEAALDWLDNLKNPGLLILFRSRDDNIGAVSAAFIFKSANRAIRYTADPAISIRTRRSNAACTSME